MNDQVLCHSCNVSCSFSCFLQSSDVLMSCISQDYSLLNKWMNVIFQVTITWQKVQCSTASVHWGCSNYGQASWSFVANCSPCSIKSVILSSARSILWSWGSGQICWLIESSGLFIFICCRVMWRQLGWFSGLNIKKT